MGAALAQGIQRLEEAGVDTPRLDAELLLAHAIGRNRTYLFAHRDRLLTGDQLDRWKRLLLRREARQPLPYLIGTWEFMGMPFHVSGAVLIPRPETETLVEAAAERLPERASILDVGTGSGCIAIALARLLPQARALALDASPAAAVVAWHNAQALAVSDRVTVRAGRFPEMARDLGAFDAVVSNPPYIPSEQVDILAPEQRLYEPRLALDGGPDGLAVLSDLIEESPALLKPGGLLALEVMQGQAEQVAALLRDNPVWGEPEILPDLGGIPRVVLARTLVPLADGRMTPELARELEEWQDAGAETRDLFPYEEGD